jgi:hypothetical protein
MRHIAGVVIDPSGAPISGARISVLKDAREIAAVQTGADGRFTFDQLGAGSYSVHVHAQGFLDASSEVTLVKPKPKSGKELNVLLQVGMGCSGFAVAKSKRSK